MNPFTENLELLIQKGTSDIGYMIRTRRGTIIRSNDLEIRIKHNGERIFSTRDGTQQWNADGSCFYSSYIDHTDDLVTNDLIRSEEV